MRISESRFNLSMHRADAMGLPADEADKFLADLKSEAGEKVIVDVARPLLRIFEGKDLKGNDAERLLSAVKTLHEYGQPHATEQIDRGDLHEWAEDQKKLIKLLVATLEGWFFGEHPINIKSEHFPIVVFLINRLAKISENQTKDPDGKLLVPDLDPDILRTFIDQVESFSAEALQPEAIDEQVVQVQTQIGENPIKSLEISKKIMEIQAQDAATNRDNPKRAKQEKRVHQVWSEMRAYQEANGREIKRELLKFIDTLIEKLTQYKNGLYSPNADRKTVSRSDLNIFYKNVALVIEYISKQKFNFVKQILEGNHRGIYNLVQEGVLSDIALRPQEYDDVSFALRQIEKDLKPDEISIKKPDVQASVEPTKVLLRTNDFASLSALKISTPTTTDIQAIPLREMLFGKLKSVGSSFDTMNKKMDELNEEQKKLKALTVTHDFKEMLKEIEALEYAQIPLYDKLRRLQALKNASKEQFIISKDNSVRDINRPGAGLYLLKSILIAIKMTADKVNAKKTDDVNPYELVGMALDINVINRGPAQVFDLKWGGVAGGRGYEAVHYLPQHMSFARMAAAMILDKNKKQV